MISTRPAAARRRPQRLRSAAGLALLVALGLQGPGCWATEPALSPRDPPPNVPPGLLLLELPESVVDAFVLQRVADQLGAKLLEADLGVGGATLSAERRAQILAHRVTTGMSVQEVIWCFLADPSRVRLQGPPGGQTLLWEPRDAWRSRYWVRFDEHGEAADAGRY
jgi:hypothetical protein